jgi:hypothetical protein
MAKATSVGVVHATTSLTPFSGLRLVESETRELPAQAIFKVDIYLCR